MILECGFIIIPISNNHVYDKDFAYVSLFKEGNKTKVAYPLENHNAYVAERIFHNGHFI